MTRYTWDVTVPAGTPQSAAVVNTVEVDEAVIQDGLIFAPPGTAGLVFAEIRFGDLVVLPSANSSRRVLPGVADAAPLNFEAEGTPYELTLRVFAPDTDFPHTITARVDAVQPANAAETVNIREADIFSDTDVSDAFEGLDTVESE
uniref:Uncharacterized protein n=1 Tax=uncultured virus TaxID=340016 RepID=D5L2D8_9VIRU|nr:hypothetical protein [uncultured virus]